MQYVIVCNTVELSGGELLLERIAKKLAKSSFVRLCCTRITQEMLSHFINSNVEIKIIERWKTNEELFEGLDITSEIRIITLLWDYYCKIISKKEKSNIKVLLYTVHPLNAISGENRNFLIQTICRFTVGRAYKKAIIKKHVVFMDEECSDKAIKFYHFDKQISNQIVHVRIATEFTQLTEHEIREKSLNPSHNILSVARSDFPFKGYLVGLLRWFCRSDIQEKFKDYRLTVISYGKDFNLLNNILAEINTETKNRIKLVGKTDTNELLQYYRNAEIFVGMGTTLIEAASMGCVCVPIASYTYDVIAESYFFENYRKLACTEHLKNNFDQLMLNASKYTNENRIEHLFKECSAASKYSVDNTVMGLENQFDIMQRNTAPMCLKLISRYYELKNDNNS